jgi:hypothetical protein
MKLTVGDSSDVSRKTDQTNGLLTKIKKAATEFCNPTFIP